MNCEEWSSGATKLGWAGLGRSSNQRQWQDGSRVASLVWLFPIWVYDRTTLLDSAWAWTAHCAGLSSGVTTWAWTARLSLSLSRLSLSFLFFFPFFLRFWHFRFVLESSTDYWVFFSFFFFFLYMFFEGFHGLLPLGWPVGLR